MDGLKTFILLTLDFMILNGYIGEKQLTKKDKYIREELMKRLR
jgi:hypothetical protein